MSQTTVYVNGKPDHVYDSGSGSSSPVPNNASQATQAADASRASGQVAQKIASGVLPDQGSAAPAPTPPATPTNTPVNTAQPSPTTANATPYTGAGPVSASEAQANLLKGGLKGNDLANAQANLSAFQQGHAATKASGVPAPQNAGAGMSDAIQTAASASQPDTSNVNDFLANNKEADPIRQIMSQVAELQNSQKNSSTLLDDYKSLYKDSGLDAINAELIHADTVINGTEQDIRNEIQSAGGMGTDSQVQAMTLARNKPLLARYNQLAQMKTDATNQLNTMMSLDGQDKQMAQARVNTQIDTLYKSADLIQSMQNAARTQATQLMTMVGADGLYAALKNDPTKLAYVEQQVGGSTGWMAKAATQAAQSRNLDIQQKQAAINASNRANRDKFQFVPATGTQPAGSFDPSTGKFTAMSGGAGTNTQAIAQTQGNIEAINSLLKPGAMSGVGTNGLLRYDPLTGLTGKQQNFLAGVNQIKDQLTLDSLTKAKQNGATFGALSDGERGILANSASKLGSWEVKDKAGNVTGYNASPKDFTAELNKINNYAKLDFVKKGGDPSAVGIQQQADGTYWTQNSDGSFTKIQ